MTNRVLSSLLISFCILTTFITPTHAQHPAPDGYESIFNGSSLDGWTMQWPGLWTVEERVLVGRQDPEHGGDSWLFTNREWDDFSLEMQFQTTAACNSGIGIRMPAGVEGRPSQYGYEIQVSDVDEQFPTGSIFRHVAASQQLHRSGWNTIAIICVADHIVVYLNRQKVVNARLEGSTKGRIGLQVHGGENFADQVVQFRNIRIKDLKPQISDALPSPIPFEARQLDDDISEGVTVTDIDRDGVLDITCGPRWYKGPDFTPYTYRTVNSDAEFMQNFGEVAKDVNRDGWMDIISGGWFEPYLYWYENPGDPATHEGLWKRHTISDELRGTETMLEADVDHDGRTDLLANRYDTTVPVSYFAYVGMENAPHGFEQRELGWNGRGHGMGFGDINDDGLNDVVTGTGWYEAPSGDKTQPWTWHGNYHVEEISAPMGVDDLNQDGLNDIIYGQGHDFGLFWLEQTLDSAGDQAWIYHTIDATFSQLHQVIMVDMDGDGTRDILTGKRYRGHAGTDPGANEPLCIFWYKVDPGPDPGFTRYIISYDENIGIGMQLRTVDIDDDGDMDIVAPGKSGLYLLENKTR